MTYAKRKAELANKTHEELESIILNNEYNDFLGDLANYPSDGDADDKHGHGKRIPYIGWYWRQIDFSRLSIPIGDCGEFVGFMANNKWDYPERELTNDEALRVIAIIDEVRQLARAGGVWSEIQAKTNAKLDELWEYMQTLIV